MSDMTSIAAAISSLKAAAEIAKAIRSVDGVLERVELKLKLAELTEAVADAKLSLAQVQETLQYKDDEIERLERMLSRQGEVARHRDAYYLVNGEGKVHGRPMCFRCWEIDRKLFELYTSPEHHSQVCCPACTSVYEKIMTPALEQEADAA